MPSSRTVMRATGTTAKRSRGDQRPHGARAPAPCRPAGRGRRPSGWCRAAGEPAVDAVGDAEGDPHQRGRAGDRGRRRSRAGTAAVTSSRMKLTALAGVARAEGPNVLRGAVATGSVAWSVTAAPRVHRVDWHGLEVRAERPVISTCWNVPTGRASGTAMTPSISGASRWVRAAPGASTSTSTRATDQCVTSRRGDRVLAARAARRAARARAPRSTLPSRPAA